MSLVRENVSNVSESSLSIVIGNMINKKYRGSQYPIILVSTDMQEEITPYTRFAWPHTPQGQTFVFVLQQKRLLYFFGLYDPATMPVLVNNMFNHQCFISIAHVAKKSRVSRKMLPFPSVDPLFIASVRAPPRALDAPDDSSADASRFIVPVEEVYQQVTSLWDLLRNPDRGLAVENWPWWTFWILLICRTDTFEMRYRSYLEGVVDQDDVPQSLANMESAQQILKQFQSKNVPPHVRNIFLDLHANYLEP